MQGLRKYLLAVSLGIAIVFAAAALSTPAAPRHGRLDDSLLTRILEFFFGVESQSRVSIPPG